MVHRAEKEDAREEAAMEEAEKKVEALKRPRPSWTPGKSMSFLAGHEEELTPILLEALSLEDRGATVNFYRFWIYRRQTYSFTTCDAVNLTKDMVSQSIQTLGFALEC